MLDKAQERARKSARKNARKNKERAAMRVIDIESILGKNKTNDGWDRKKND